MNELALFSGAGGGILGGTLLGWRTVCAVEIDAYAASVLLARQNDGVLSPFPIWDDIRTFDGKPWRGIIDMVSGGFPCQDISCAGKGKGIEGERSGLWCEMARVVREVRPKYVFVENSPMLTIRGLHVVLGDLAAMGYDVENPNRGRLSESSICKEQPRRTKIIGSSENMAHPSRILEGREDQRTESIDVSDPSIGGQPIYGSAPGQPRYADELHEDVPNPNESGRHGWPGRSSGRREEFEIICSNPNIQGLPLGQGKSGDNGQEQPPAFETDWWFSEPDVGRVANGVAARMDRLKAIGNGQVPAVAALAWKILFERINA